MTYTRSRIALLLAGGGTLDPRQRRSDQVRKASDVAAWFRKLGELQMIGEVTPVFVYAAPAGGEPADWHRLHQAIEKVLPRVDGVAVLHELTTLPLAAAATALAFPQPGKPIIFSSSPYGTITTALSRGSGLSPAAGHANVLNSLQAATSHTSGVMVAWGNRILPATKVLLDWTDRPQLRGTDDRSLAKIDFGVRWTQPLARRSAKKTPAGSRTKFAPGVLVVPGSLHDAQVLARTDLRTVAGVLVQMGKETHLHPVLQDFCSRAVKAGRPVALSVSRRLQSVPAGIVVLTGLTPAVAQVKFQWALAQTKQSRRLQQLIDRPLAIEEGVA